MTFLKLKQKIKTSIWSIIINNTRNTFIYNFIYKSYWNYIFHKPNPEPIFTNFYTANLNIKAGIGHQISNWNSGFWFSKQFGLKYAHSPFSTSEWDYFLGFGENEILVSDLIKNGYQKVRLPLFDEFNSSEIALQKKIIATYSNRKVVFVAEQDQGYRDQFGVMAALKEKFFNAKSRINDQLFYNINFLNIAIHIRRGDIVIGQDSKNPNLQLRWQGNEYYINVLTKFLNNLKPQKPIAIYLFSQGKIEEFAEFKQFENLHFCLDVNPMSSFLHLVFADILITSKSSFSYKPALLNKGIKISPKDFWHGYPMAANWFLADESGKMLNEFPATNE